MSTLPSNSAFRPTLSPFRLRRHADYGSVYKASRKHFSSSMAYFVRRRSAEERAQGPRIGLTVGRVMGKAVDRNRIKRRMREAIRLELHLLHDPVPAIDLVLHPRKSVATMDFPALQRELAKVFAQVARLAVDPSARLEGASQPSRRAAPRQSSEVSTHIPAEPQS